MKKVFPLLGISLLLGFLSGPRAWAASTDIVPRGSAVLDAFATLARVGAFGMDTVPSDFLGVSSHTRGELAHLLEQLAQEEIGSLDPVKKDPQAGIALRTALAALRPEYTVDAVDMAPLEAVAEAAPLNQVAVGGYVQPEVRVGSGSQSKSGVLGIYRATALGNLRDNIRYVVSASNWPEDYRRVFQNDVGAHDFSGVNEAYLELNGGRGLTVDLGRMYNRWGPGSLGATLLSDNAPALDQIQVAFPFSLGPHLGREYRFTQLLSTFEEGGERKYFVAQRYEVAVSPRFSADFQQAFKASRSRALALALIPDYYNAKNANLSAIIPRLRIGGLEDYYNSVLNAGLTYQADPRLRVYGQFALDDLRSPGSHSGLTPRKIAYLVGFAAQPAAATGLVAEYSFADPTIYTFHTTANQWQKGQYNELALPTGPNARDVYVRLDQKLTPQLSLSLSGRDRRRHDDSFPMPNTRDLSAAGTYSLNHRSDVQLIFHDYRQNPFPLDPSVPVGNGFQPSNAEGLYGERLRIRQLEVAYQFFF